MTRKELRQMNNQSDNQTGDTTAPSPPVLQRAIGKAQIGFHLRGGKTVLDTLYQSGCSKIRLPRVEPGQETAAIVINTSGGLTDRDHITTHIHWGTGTTASVASQAAERIYRSRRDPAIISTTLKVDDKAIAFWLPQETILFDHGRLRRNTTLDLAPSAKLLAVEAIQFGRTAMGETVSEGHVFDRWQLRIAGDLVFADQFRLNGPIADILARPAVADGATCLATLLYAGPDAKSYLERLRMILAAASSQAGVSYRDNLLICRIVAPTSAEMRTAIIAVANAIRLTLLMKPGATLPAAGLMPRVWSC